METVAFKMTSHDLLNNSSWHNTLRTKIYVTCNEIDPHLNIQWIEILSELNSIDQKIRWTVETQQQRNWICLKYELVDKKW